MATIREDDKWECTAEMQQALITLHSKDKKKWKADVSKMIRDHPSKFSILTVGVEDDGDNLYTFNEFAAHFGGSLDDKTLLELIYNDIDHFDDSHIKFIAIHRWMNDVKLQKETQIIKNHKWLFTKILHVQAAHLDADGSGEVDRQEFVSYFVDKIGFPSKIANAMFDDIDVNNDGDLSIMEYTKWKNKHNKPDKLKKFLDKMEKKIAAEIKGKKTMEKKNDEMDDVKCQQCETLKKEIKALNNKYDSIELKLKSVQSKHTNLLQDYKKLSKLLDEEKAKEKSNGTGSSDNASKNKAKNGNDKALQKEIKIRTTELHNMKQTNENLEKQMKKVRSENEELKQENVSLSEKNNSSKDMREKISKLEMNIKLRDEEIETYKQQMSQQTQNGSNNNSFKMKMYETENEELNEKIDGQNKKMKEFKKQCNEMEEENDAIKIELNTATEEIKLLKERMNLNTRSDSDKSKQFRERNETLEFKVEKQRKEMKKLKAEMEEEQDNMDKVEAEKRRIKAELNKKDGEIAILSHKLELTQQNADLYSGSDNDQIKKLQAHNRELDDENMQQQINMKSLKEQIQNLSQDISREKELFNKLQIELNKEKSSLENYEKLKEIQTKKTNEKEKEMAQMFAERQELKQEIMSLNGLLRKHDIEKEKISAEKQALLNKVEKEKNNQVALMQQFDQMESKQTQSVCGVQQELETLKQTYAQLEIKCTENERKQSEIVNEKESLIMKLENENTVLQKKVQTEKNHLEAVLLEVTQLEEKQADLDKEKVCRVAIGAKHDLSKLNIQIEILNSDTFRMRSLLLLSKYEKLDKKKYYGFLDFAGKDLSEKALANVYKKLGVKDKISAQALAPLLGVIVKLYEMRLGKLKSGFLNKNKNKNKNVGGGNIDRRVIEHLGVWIIRQHSKKTNKSQTIAVLSDTNEKIKATYVVYDGYVLKKEMGALFASWCHQYVECRGCHHDSRLK